MAVKQVVNRLLLSVTVVAITLFVGGNAQAIDNITDQNTADSVNFGFNPNVNLIPAATRDTTVGGPCFKCPNTSPDAGGTTAGALTDNMDGIIKTNNLANVGQEGFLPTLQGQSGIPGGLVNNASGFTVTISTPGIDFLDAGSPVANPNPTVDLDGNPLGTVGTAGMSMGFSNSFTFRPGAGSFATQNMVQSTFTGQDSEDSVQLVRFIDSFDQSTPQVLVSSGAVDATVNWDQTIQEGGFLLSNNVGSFTYNGNTVFPAAAAPTGPGQTQGLAPTCIGGGGVC